MPPAGVAEGEGPEGFGGVGLEAHSTVVPADGIGTSSTAGTKSGGVKKS